MGLNRTGFCSSGTGECAMTAAVLFESAMLASAVTPPIDLQCGFTRCRSFLVPDRGAYDERAYSKRLRQQTENAVCQRV
jgi:hypothetical protein